MYNMVTPSSISSFTSTIPTSDMSLCASVCRSGFELRRRCASWARSCSGWRSRGPVSPATLPWATGSRCSPRRWGAPSPPPAPGCSPSWGPRRPARKGCSPRWIRCAGSSGTPYDQLKTNIYQNITTNQKAKFQRLTWALHQLVKTLAPAADFLQCGSVKYNQCKFFLFSHFFICINSLFAIQKFGIYKISLRGGIFIGILDGQTIKIRKKQGGPC